MVPNKENDNKNKYINASFQVDTVAHETNSVAYYNPDDNAVIFNYRQYLAKQPTAFNQKNLTLIHEQKHKDNAAKGMHAWPVSSEQAYKLNMHDEISATMCEIIALRDEYIKTGNIKVFDKKPGAKFYADAIKNGSIYPGSPYQEDFDKEMALLVNGCKKSWLENSEKDYRESSVASSIMYGDARGEYAKYHDENYQKAMKIAYTIGGVDFTKYMDKDVEVSKQGKEMLGKALREGLYEPQSRYQRFLAGSCDFFGMSPSKKSDIIASAQGKKGLKKQIMAPVGATFAAAMEGSVQYLEDVYHKFFPIKNQPIRSVNTETAKYKKWKDKDGHRVSAVQQKKILNMNEDIIQKPTKPGSCMKARFKLSNEAIKGKIGKDKLNFDRKYKVSMIQQIKNIKTGNQSLDAEKIADTICQKFGQNAYALLQQAIQHPDCYAKVTGDYSIKNPGDAVEYLCNMKNTKSNQQIVQMILNRQRNMNN